ERTRDGAEHVARTLEPVRPSVVRALDRLRQQMITQWPAEPASEPGDAAQGEQRSDARDETHARRPERRHEIAERRERALPAHVMPDHAAQELRDADDEIRHALDDSQRGRPEPDRGEIE